MIVASLKQLPWITLVIVSVIATVTAVRAWMGSTWEEAVSSVDILYWLFVIVALSLYKGWQQRRKEGASAV